MPKIRILLLLVAGLVAGCGTLPWSENETEISMDEAPAAVQQSVRELVGDGELEEIEYVVEDGATYYEVEYEKAGVEREAEIAPDGKVLEDGVHDD